MEPLDLESIKARERAASAGPWTQTWDLKFGAKLWAADTKPIFAVVSGIAHARVSADDRAPQWQKDCDFVRAARQDIPALLAEVERLRAAGDARPQPAWQPIETAPKDWTMILLYPSRCWVDDCDCGEVGYWDVEMGEWGGAGSPADDYSGPTHWMPLPVPPEPKVVSGVAGDDPARSAEE